LTRNAVIFDEVAGQGSFSALPAR